MKMSDLIPVYQSCHCYWHQQIRITKKRQKTIRIRCKGKTYAVVHEGRGLNNITHPMCKVHFEKFQHKPYPHTKIEMVE